MTPAPPHFVRRVDLAPAMPGVSEIVLDRPDKRNAQTPAMVAEIARLAREVSPDPSVRAIVVRGEGRAFCAGFDLELCRDDDAALPALLRGLSDAVRALRRARPPVVIAAQGAAIAGGCALLGGADLVVSHASAKIGYPAVLLGISPAVSAPTVRQAMTDAGARRAMLDPAVMSGEEAKRRGLVHILVDTPEDVVPRAQIEAAEFAKKPPDAVGATKRWLNTLDGSMDDSAFDAALAASMATAGTPEQRAMLEAALRSTGAPRTRA